MKIQHFVPLAFLALAASASAEGFYGVGQITESRASLDRSHFDSELLAHGATGLSSQDTGNGTEWRLQGGYRFNPYLSVEMGYIDFGKAKYEASYKGGSASGSLKAGGLDAVALFSLPIGDSFSVFGKGGVVFADVKSSLSANGPASLASQSTSSTVARPLFGVGGSYKLTQNVDLRADFDHVGGLGNSGKTGKMDVNMFSLGAVYNF